MRTITRLALLGTIVSTIATPARAQLTGAIKWADSARVAIEAAAASGDAQRLEGARALVERALTVYPNDPLLLHYQGYALYREASQLVGRQQMAAAAPLVERAAAALEQSEQRRPMPETLALLAMLYGQQIAIDPSKGMTLGMLAGQTMGEAAGMGPNNPRVSLLRGMTALFTPPEYGGGLAIADEHLTRALVQFESDHPAPGLPAWGRAEAHVWLGQVRLRAGDTTRAVAQLREALAVAPDHAWAKSLLASLGRAPK